MIFHETWQQVLDGKKTQTRRLVKGGDFEVDWPMKCVFRDTKSGNRLAWRENQTYAVQSGRGKKAIGRIGVTKIKREKLQDISKSDALAEIGDADTLEELIERFLLDGTFDHRDAAAMALGSLNKARWVFRSLWNSIHPKGKQWHDNPEVWVLEFELVND